MSAVIIQGEKLAFALERIWGWPTKLARRAFANFGDVHIVPPERVPPLASLTIWQAVDPHGDRNWFMTWTGVDAEGRKWTFAEWPDETMGEWALPGSRQLGGKPAMDGKEGPAQTMGGGKAFDDYKRLILEIEGWEPNGEGVWAPGPEAWKIHDRLMDPRPAGTTVPSAIEGRTYLDYMSDAVVNARGQTVVPGLDFRAGRTCGVAEAKGFVNNWINDGWDPQAEVTPMNMPQWFVSAACPNTIWALRMWTGADGDKGACKDPIDNLKSLSIEDIHYVAPGAIGTQVGPGGY